MKYAKFSQGNTQCSRDESLEGLHHWVEKYLKLQEMQGCYWATFILGLSVCHRGKIRFDKLIETHVKLEFKQLIHHNTSFRTVSRRSV
jgi:hypothetical protein